jgi:pyruvate kinase
MSLNILRQRTKIICTLGPSTDRAHILERLIREGMSVARLNAAHGTADEHRRRIESVRRISRKLSLPVAVLVDLPGPKLRLGRLPTGSMELRRASSVTLGIKSARAGADLPVDDPRFIADMRVGEVIFLADGTVKLMVTNVWPKRLRCRVVVGGTVRTESGINIPGLGLTMQLPTKEDVEWIKFACANKADWIGVSFVRSAKDISRVRAVMRKAAHRPMVMAKIEKQQALEQLEEIIEESDGVMVARGDLGVETPLIQVPIVQKKIISTANELGRPVVTATQMLESMVEHAQPTRAEVTDVANAILDGTDGVMLSAETAIGRFPVEAVRTLHGVIIATESAYTSTMARRWLDMETHKKSSQSMSFVTCEMAYDLNAKAIITPIDNFSAAAELARFRPRARILAMTKSDLLRQQLAIVWGITPIYSPSLSPSENCILPAVSFLRKQGIARPKDPLVFLSNTTSSVGLSDTIQVVYLGS